MGVFRPDNAKELFNLRHASLRNVIERIFGILKRKFKILATVGEYSVNTQIHLVLALTGLFNFIRDKEGIDLLLEDHELDDTDSLGDSTPISTGSKSAATKAMEKLRDQISIDMWQDYCKYVGRED
jgi:hypothetical protein